MRLRLVIQAPGGKYSSARQLLEYFPVNFAEYREPFCYSAGMYAHISPHIRRSISDINPAPVRVFQRLRDDASFLDEIMGLGDVPVSEIRREFLRRRELCRPPLYDPLSFIYVSQYAYLAMARVRERRDVAVYSYRRSKRVWRPRLKDLRIWRALLRDTDISCCDYAEALERPGRSCMIFLDPPYEFDHALYDHRFTARDWFLLACRLRQCRHRFLMTVGDGPLIRDLFHGRPFRMFERRYRGAEYTRGTGTHHEDWIITNYDPPNVIPRSA